MKSIENIYEKTWVSYDPEYYKYLKTKLKSAIDGDREKLNAYKMVCESYKVLNFNIVIISLMLSFAGLTFSVLPEKLMNKNIADFAGIIWIIFILAIVCIPCQAIVMNNKEKKYQQILSVLKDIEKEEFSREQSQM